jgi:hypothetical protein
MCLTSKKLPLFTSGKQAGHILMLIVLSIKTFSEQHIESFAVFAVAFSLSYESDIHSWQGIEFENVKPGGTYSNQWGLHRWPVQDRRRNA